MPEKSLSSSLKLDQLSHLKLKAELKMRSLPSDPGADWRSQCSNARLLWCVSGPEPSQIGHLCSPYNGNWTCSYEPTMRKLGTRRGLKARLDSLVGVATSPRCSYIAWKKYRISHFFIDLKLTTKFPWGGPPNVCRLWTNRIVRAKACQ